MATILQTAFSNNFLLKKLCLAFIEILLQLDTRASINPYRAGTELTRFDKVNIMAADALAPYVARTSAALILIM